MLSQFHDKKVLLHWSLDTPCSSGEMSATSCPHSPLSGLRAAWGWWDSNLRPVDVGRYSSCGSVRRSKILLGQVMGSNRSKNGHWNADGAVQSNFNPTPTPLAVMGSPMLKDPHYSQQDSCLHRTGRKHSLQTFIVNVGQVNVPCISFWCMGHQFGKPISPWIFFSTCPTNINRKHLE